MPEPAAAPWFETAFGAHYPLLYRHRDAAEAEGAVDLLSRLVPLGAPVCDLGCGDGRHLVALAARGIPALGIDLSPALLAVAAGREALAATPLVRADMRALPLRDRAVGTVLSLFTAFGYFAGDRENADAVRGIARVLRPGGSWILDYLDADAVRSELGDGRPHRRERTRGPLAVCETRRLDQAARRVVKSVAIAPLAGREAEAAAWGVAAAGIGYEERVALYGLDELDAMGAATGLERVAAAGDYDGRPLGEGSRWILAYRKTPGSPA